MRDRSGGIITGVLETLIVTTALAGVAGTGLGGLIGAMLQKDSNRTVSLLLSFAGGVMLSVVSSDLVIEAVETDMGILTVIGAIIIGVAVTFLLNYLIDRKTNPEVPHIDENHPKTADDLDELLIYVSEHLQEKITVRDTARKLHVSESTVTHLCSKRLGLSFYRYVTQQRLDKARQLMLENEDLSSVAEKAGFCDYTAFFRAFKQEYGLSPSEYRKIHG